mmetsp:Transcript_515/g.925  ORF Transcript_515/g.925 Transcript_515/m.925 type:complete len:101 (+) Transcript_515:351-653(+)
MAFVSGVSVGKSALAVKRINKADAFCVSPKTVNRSGNRSMIVAQAEKDKKGWTFYSEQLNGRLAMTGFTLALVTEIIAPTHPSLLQQVNAVVPIGKLLGL